MSFFHFCVWCFEEMKWLVSSLMQANVDDELFTFKDVNNKTLEATKTVVKIETADQLVQPFDRSTTFGDNFI
jgi:hypothetical protein